MIIQDLINDMIQEKIKSSEILKHVRGVVSEVDENNEFATVQVNQNYLTLVNKANEELIIGDEVTIHYWTNIGNGWIALRHGVSNLKSKTLSVDTAAVLSLSQSDEVTSDTDIIATYDNLTAKYGGDENAIIINGYVVYPMSVSDDSLNNKDTDYNNMVTNAKIGYKEVLLNELSSDDNTVIAERYSEEYIGKYWDGDDQVWYTEHGCVKNSTNEIVMPKSALHYLYEANLKLFYKSIYSSATEKSALFEHGCADIIIARKNSKLSYAPDFISLTVGFSSDDEYNYAIATSVKSEVTKV